MKQIIAFVGKMDGSYFARTPEGETRALKPGDPVYVGEAVFSQNDNPDGKFIELIKANGEKLFYTDTSYVILDNNVAGNDNPSRDQRYTDRQPQNEVVLDGRGQNSGNTQHGVEGQAVIQPTPRATPSNVFSAGIIPPAGTGTTEIQQQQPEQPGGTTPPSPAPAPSSHISNTAPYSENSEVTGVEDTHYAFTTGDFHYGDADGDPFGSVMISTLPGNGTLYLNNIPVYAGELISAADISAGHLTFLPNPNENGNDYTEFTYFVNDGKSFSPTPSVMTVNVTPVPDPTVFQPHDTSYTENGTPVPLGGALNLTDPDTAVTGATVVIKTGMQPGDTLAVNTAGTSINAVYDAVHGTVTLTGTDTAAHYQAVLSSITFYSSSEDPTMNGTATERTLEWTVTNADSETFTQDTTMSVTPLTDAPILNVTGNVLYTSAPVNALSSASLTDVDDTNMSRATVAITSGFTSGDLLNASTAGTSITASYNSSTGVLTLTGTDTAEHYRSVLAGITYSSNNPDPISESLTRTLTWNVTDADSDGAGPGTSTSVTSTINLVGFPVAYQAADVNLTEKSYDGSNTSVSGNLFSDGTDHATGVDYIPAGDTGRINQVTYLNASGVETTATLASTSTVLDTKYGLLTINRDTGAYTFTSDSPIDHTSGDSVTETFSYNIKDTTTGNVSNFAAQNVIIADGANPLVGAGASATLYEKNLSNGSSPDAAALTKTGSLNVTGGSDTFDTHFTSSALTYLQSLALTSNGAGLTYNLSPDGHTLTATAGAQIVFTLNITNPAQDTAGYSFVLSSNFDKPGDVVMNVPFTVADHDGDTAAGSIAVTVADDASPASVNVVTPEDTVLTFTTNADVHQGATSISDPVHGTAHVNADGTITYTPTTDYSGADQFTYTTNTEQGPVTTTVNVTVNPVSDAPTWTGTTSYSTDEDTPVTMSGLTMPVLKDVTDQNGAAAGDHSEKLGYITLTSLDNGVTIYNGANLVFTANGSNTMTIAIVDGSGNIDTTYHYTDLNPNAAGVIKLTEAQYEALSFHPAANSGTDVDFTVNATSYETDDSGNRLTAVAGASSSQNVHVEVAAVTDPVDINLASGSTVTGNEDTWIRIDTLFTNTIGDYTDNSETHKMTISGLPAGWSYSTTGSGSGTAVGAGGTFTVTIPNGQTSVPIYVKPPTNDSSDVTGLTATLSATDHDSDTSVTPSTLTDSVSFNITVDPVSDAPAITGSGAGKEDTKIPFTVNADVTDNVTTDGSVELIKTVTISNIPVGAKLYTADGSTQLTDGTQTSYTVTGAIDSPTYTGTFTILPPQDSNTDIHLTVTATSQDGTAAAGSGTGTVTIDVQGVVDTSAGDADYGDAGRLYVELNHVLTDGSTTVMSTNEDTSVDLGITLKSYENVTNGTTDGSERITVVIKNHDSGDGSGFSLVDGSGNKLGVLMSDGWHLTETQAEQAHLLPSLNYSGTINLDVVTTVQDMNSSNSADDTNVQTDRIQLSVAPVTDTPEILVREVFTQEDQTVALDVRPLLHDDSETAVSVKIDNIPVGAALKLADGTTIYVNDGSSVGSYTLVFGGTTQTGFNHNTTSGTITAADLAGLQFTPPPHSNTDVILSVTPTAQDGAAAPASQTYPVTVHLQGVADAPVTSFTAGSNGSVTVDGAAAHPGDVYTTGAIVVSGQELTSVNGYKGVSFGMSSASGELSTVVTTSASPLYQHVSMPGDTSETITYLLDNVPANVRLVAADGTTFVGTYMGDGTSGGSKWSLTQSEMSGLMFQTPQDYSGVIHGMTMTTIVTENDGNSTTVTTPFTLDVTPEVTTGASVIGGASGSEDGLVMLGFGGTADASEHITGVTISQTGIPSGYTLMVTDDGVNWHALTPSGGVYDITSYYNGHAALQVDAGGAYAQKDGSGGTITGISVTVQDSTDAGGTPVSEVITGSMDIALNAVADAPVISAASGTLSGTCAASTNLGLSAVFADTDGSETHYFIIKNVPDGCWLSNASFNGDGTWYVAPENIGNVALSASYGAASGTYGLTVEGYSVEGSNGDTAISSKNLSFDLTVSCGGGGGGGYIANTPTLSVTPVTTAEDSTTLTLGQFVTAAALNNTDGGTETLTFVITNLPAGVTLTSLDSSVTLVHYNDESGNPAIRLMFSDTNYITDLGKVAVTLPQDYSGDLSFTLTAVATETGNGYPETASTPATITAFINPVADSLTVQSSTTTIAEDSRTPLILHLGTSDTYTSGSDYAETVGNVKLSVGSYGSLVKSDGTVLASSNLSVIVHPDGTVTTTGGDQVYVISASQDSSHNVDITVTADVTDTATVNGSLATNTAQSSASISIDVTSVPDPAGKQDDSGATSVLSVANASTAEDTKVLLNISAIFADNDGSEMHSLKITGIPVGALIVDSAGNLVGQNNGDGTWKGSLEDVAAGIYFLPPADSSGVFHLGLNAYAIEKDTFATDYTTTSFDVTVTGVADGVVITPHDAAGDAGDFIRPAGTFLEGALVETETYKQSPYYDPAHPDASRMDELYKVVFTGTDKGMTFYYEEGGVYHQIVNESHTTGEYAMSCLTQAQLDSLSFVSHDITGTIGLDVSVYSQEVNASGDVISTSSAQTGNLVIDVTPVADTATVDNLHYDSGVTHFSLLSSLSGSLALSSTDSGTVINSSNHSDIQITSSGSDTAFDVTVADVTGSTDTLLTTLHVGTSGSDTFNYSSHEIFEGLGGSDTIKLSDSIDLSSAKVNFNSIENIDMTGTNDNSISHLTVNDFITMSGTSDAITITGNTGDSVSLSNASGGSWVSSGSAGGYNVYSCGTHVINIDTHIHTTVTG